MKEERSQRRKNAVSNTPHTLFFGAVFFQPTQMNAAPESVDDVSFFRVGPFFVPKSAPDIGIRQTTRLKQLVQFFDEPMLRGVLLPLISVKSSVSLRVVDWLVTNHAKRHDVTVRFGDKVGGIPERIVNLHHEYRAWLRVWRRRLFDPFARRSRVFFEVEGSFQATTVAQLNFILFAHQLGVIDFVKKHVSVIEREMNHVLRSKQHYPKEDPDGEFEGPKRKRRTELSEPPSTYCGIFEVPCIVRWK